MSESIENTNTEADQSTQQPDVEQRPKEGQRREVTVEFISANTYNSEDMKKVTLTVGSQFTLGRFYADNGENPPDYQIADGPVTYLTLDEVVKNTKPVEQPATQTSTETE